MMNSRLTILNEVQEKLSCVHSHNHTILENMSTFTDKENETDIDLPTLNRKLAFFDTFSSTPCYTTLESQALF